MGSRAARLAVIAAAIALLGLGQAELARAAVGDVRRDLPAGSPGGVSVAFDGQNLYYTDRNGAVLHSMTPTGSARPDVPIIGAAGLNALAYDATLDQFWAVDSTGLGIYRLSKSGAAELQFALIPALDLPGLCDVLTGCNALVTGLAFDASDSSLWYAPQLSERVYHIDTAGQLLGYFDTNDATGSLFPDCLTNGVTGLAAGASSLYLSAGSCGRGFRYGKTNAAPATKLGTFALPGSAGDVECDDRTFAATVLWVRDAVNGHVRAVEVAPGTCAFGGGVSLLIRSGWMSGGGQVLTNYGTLGSHALHLLCTLTDPLAPTNNLVVNWKDALGNQFGFHLTALDFVECFFVSPPGSNPPSCPEQTDACFNKIHGHGSGWLRGRRPDGTIIAGANKCTDCGEVEFDFTDQGEPNQLTPTEGDLPDNGSVTIIDKNNPVDGTVLACGCTNANYQAHQRPS